jgi:hypothetical protein
VNRLRRAFPGGSDGNEQLTAILASILLVLLAVEGATLLDIRGLLSVHAFVGILLIPVVVLKLGSTTWRMARYYLGSEAYVRRGPPHLALRVVVAPLIVLSTTLLLGSGIALLALSETSGTLVALHQASFIVWLGATGAHVLGHVLKLPRLIGSRPPGTALRVVAAAGAVAAGLSLAVATIPAADHLQDAASAQIGFDEG